MCPAAVARLLNKLLIEQTKSRPRHSNDNGLVETKNGAVIRKHMGYGYLDAAHAEPLQHFYTAHFNPYLNYHRPCAQAEVEVDDKGRKRCFYRRYQTPLEAPAAVVAAASWRLRLLCSASDRRPRWARRFRGGYRSSALRTRSVVDPG